MAKVLKYIILILTILNVPSTFFFYVSPAISTVLSYLIYALLMAYFIVAEKHRPNLWMIAIGISYFAIGGLNFAGDKESDYFITFTKYIIMIICGSALVKKVTKDDIFFLYFLGSISIIVHAVAFPDNYGRYSGFYIDPNQAGFVCLMAYALTFRIKKFPVRTLLQVIITVAGVFTFSRTFILIWLLINLMSVKIEFKNIRIIGVGVGLIILIAAIGPLLKLNTDRLETFTAVVNQNEGALQKAGEASRSETWSYYYEPLKESPIFGNGYGSFMGGVFQTFGVHNTYILVLGEAGIIAFFLLTSLYLYFLYMGVVMFKEEHHVLMQSIALFLFLLTFHNYFTTDHVLIATLWIANQISNYKKKKSADALPQPS